MALAAPPVFTASLDRESVTVNETATLTLSFEGGSPTKLPDMPVITNLTIDGPRGRGNTISYVNGQTTSIYTFTYAVIASHEGTYMIPALAAEIDGHVARSAPVSLWVGPPVKLPPNSGNAFLNLMVPKTNLFLGEVLPLEIKIYFLAMNAREVPQFEKEGFTIGTKFPQSGKTVSLYNNRRYYTVSLYNYAIPVKAGKLTLGPATMPVQIPRPNGPADFFGQPLEWTDATLQSEALGINVQPLPYDNRPASFNGAVGNFTMTVDASPTNVAVGDPITVKIQITGTGALDTLTLPNQTGWDRFKLYPPTSELQTSDNLGITGTKTFKLTAVPLSMDMRELPGYQFSYFDPDQKSFRTLTHPPIPLTLRPSAASLPPANLPASPAAGDGTQPPRDIAGLKQRMGTLAQIQPPLAVRGWFMLAQFIPVALWLSLLARRKRAERLAANPQLRRQRLVDRIVRDGVKALKRAAQQNDAETFFATAFRLLQEQLGERLDRPASAITESVLEDPALVSRLPEETLEAMRDLFHTLNAARYAPQSSDTELLSLAVTVEDALNVLKQLQA